MSQEQTTNEPKESKKNGRLKRVLLGAGIVLFLFAAMAAQTYYITSRQGGDKEPVESEPAKKEQVVINKFEMEPFTVNLKDLDHRRYVRIDITLEYGDKAVGEELELKKHRIRDRINMLLMQKGVADLDGSDKQEGLHQELLREINELLEQDIREIYFENFILQ